MRDSPIGSMNSRCSGKEPALLHRNRACLLKVIPQYCIAHPYCAGFSRHQRAQISACTYTTKEISLKLSTIAK